MTTAQLKLAHDNGRLEKLTIAEIREIMKDKGVSISGKKAELVERLAQWVEDHA